MTSSPEPAPDRRRYLGLDLGGTNIKVAVVEERDAGLPLLVERETRRTEAHRGPDVVVGRLAEVGRDALDRHGPVAAVGVGLPGVYDQDGRAVLLPNLPGDWNGVPVQAPLAEALGMPLALVNDARAFSLAEAVLGAARGLGTLEEAVRRRVFLAPPERVRVLPAALGPYAGAAGAALRGREAAREALNTASIA
jgi:predicted NBD/HSP70 family sugar kinase